MNAREIARKSLQPFDNLGVIKNYFAAVKAMDSAAVADRPFDTKRIMGLWHEDGTLTIGASRSARIIAIPARASFRASIAAGPRA